jgi:hypothetical protein
MAVLVRIKPSGSQDVVSYQVYMKSHVQNEIITKENASIKVVVPLDEWEDRGDGYIYCRLDNRNEFAGLDGYYDFAIAAIDDAGNISPLLTQGLSNVGVDLLAPNPPTEASIIFE